MLKSVWTKQQQSVGSPTDESTLVTVNWSAPFEPHPYAKMGGSVAGLGLFKAGHADSCSKHLTHGHVEQEQNSVLLQCQNLTLQPTTV